jgi:hypothetical protein
MYKILSRAGSGIENLFRKKDHLPEFDRMDQLRCLQGFDSPNPDNPLYGAHDLFLIDVYNVQTLDHYFEDRLEDGATAALYHVNFGLLGGTTIKSPRRMKSPDARMYLSFKAAKTGDSEIPIYSFIYKPNQNTVDVVISDQSTFLTRGSLRLDDKVRKKFQECQADGTLLE